MKPAKPSAPQEPVEASKASPAKINSLPGYTAVDCLANLFTVRYPMAPDTAAEDIPTERLAAKPAKATGRARK